MAINILRWNMTKIEKSNKDKFILKVLIISALIILVACLEATMTAKSRGVFEAFLKVNPSGTYYDFVNIVLINFFMTIVEPLLISLYTYFLSKKYGVNRIYKLVFTAILLVRFINLLLKFNLSSIFYYIILVLYLVLIITILAYPTEQRKVKNGIQ